jgi:cold-inducible RNA-binding protein
MPGDARRTSGVGRQDSNIDVMKRKVNRQTLQSLGGFLFVRFSCPCRIRRGMNTTLTHFFLCQGKREGLFANHEEAKMNKNLYVGNLSQKVTEDDLRNNFSEAGAVVSVSIIKDKFSGVSRGFGFVEMETEEGAQEAIKKFNGGDLDGKTITVNEARPKKESTGPRRDQNRGGGYRGGGRGRY